jgi:hypothetical protein
MTNSLSYWLGQRLRDFFMWPFNLVRDFPIRASRLARTLARAINGTLFFVPELVDAKRHDELRSWWRLKGRHLVDWAHQLLSQLFDLLGGPEITAFLIHLTSNTTPLTGDEIKDISFILGPHGMRYGDIRLVEGGLLNLVFRLNGNLAFATWHSINLPQTGKHTRQNRGLLIHELTHIYQYERIGSRYIGEALYMLIKTKRDCYNYGGPQGLAAAAAAGRRYHQYNREQQAMIIQDYYDRSKNGLETAAYEPFIAQLRSGEL